MQNKLLITLPTLPCSEEVVEYDEVLDFKRIVEELPPDPDDDDGGQEEVPECWRY